MVGLIVCSIVYAVASEFLRPAWEYYVVKTITCFPLEILGHSYVEQTSRLGVVCPW